MGLSGKGVVVRGSQKHVMVRVGRGLYRCCVAVTTCSGAGRPPGGVPAACEGYPPRGHHTKYKPVQKSMECTSKGKSQNALTGNKKVSRADLLKGRLDVQHGGGKQTLLSEGGQEMWGLKGSILGPYCSRQKLPRVLGYAGLPSRRSYGNRGSGKCSKYPLHVAQLDYWRGPTRSPII